MKFEVALFVFLLVNGQWVSGEPYGFGHRLQPDWKTCTERKHRGQSSPMPKAATKWKWMCAKRMIP